MPKVEKKFSFIYPVVKGRVDLFRKGGWRYDHVTDLIVSGVAYDLGNGHGLPVEERYDFDIEQVTYEDKDVLPLLEAFDSLHPIEDACYHHIQNLFMGSPSDYEVPEFSPGEARMGKVVSMPLKRYIN